MALTRIESISFIEGKGVGGGVVDPISHEMFTRIQIRETGDPDLLVLPIVIGPAHEMATESGRSVTIEPLIESTWGKIEYYSQLALETLAETKDLGGMEVRAGRFYQGGLQENVDFLYSSKHPLYIKIEKYLVGILGFQKDPDSTFSIRADKLLERLRWLDAQDSGVEYYDPYSRGAK